jgi:hypothetical protein
LPDRSGPNDGNGRTAGGGATAADLPTALMRRVPVRPEAYQRWLTVWNELHHSDSEAMDLAVLADRHGFSVRQVEFIRRAGQAHLLDSPTPPTRRGTTTINLGRERERPPSTPQRPR